MNPPARGVRVCVALATVGAASMLAPLPASALGAHVTLVIATNPADGTDIGVSFDTATGPIAVTLDDDGGSDPTHLDRANVDSDDPTVQMTLVLPTGWALGSVTCANSSEPTIDGTAITVTVAGAAECLARLHGPPISTSYATSVTTTSTVAGGPTSSSEVIPLPLAGPPAPLGSLATTASQVVPSSVVVALAPATVARPVLGRPLLTG